MWSRAQAAENMFPHPLRGRPRGMRIRTRSASSARGGVPSAHAPPAAGAACTWRCTGAHAPSERAGSPPPAGGPGGGSWHARRPDMSCIHSAFDVLSFSPQVGMRSYDYIIKRLLLRDSIIRDSSIKRLLLRDSY
eukprot:9504017-Pyramimonas_sp.AAC.4